MDRDKPDDVTACVAVREPSNGVFVTLAEALTWIAFSHAVSADELRAFVEGEPPRLSAATRNGCAGSFPGMTIRCGRSPALVNLPTATVD